MTGNVEEGRPIAQQGAHVEGFNANKPMAKARPHYPKMGTLRQGNPASVLLGSSRVGDGFDPVHPGLLQPAYNLGYGGVTVDIDFQNISGKTMRSIVFTITPYDENGNQITGEVNPKSETELTAEGYFRSDGGYYSRNWESVWYSSMIKYLQVNAVTITYLDDSTLTISNPDDLYKMAIHADTKSYLYWWSGYPIGSKETQDLKPASPAPVRSEPIQ